MGVSSHDEELANLNYSPDTSNSVSSGTEFYVFIILELYNLANVQPDEILQQIMACHPPCRHRSTSQETAFADRQVSTLDMSGQPHNSFKT
jgi:hypothetical protein